MAKEKKEKDGVVDSVKVAAERFFQQNKGNIYDKVDEPYVVSTGVVPLDLELGGGIPSGILVRLLGVPTSGKSSEGLLIIKNFLETRKRARALIIPTEARLTEKLRNRSGVKFVEKPEDWVNGTCLILPMNVYEKLASFIYTLVKTNEMHKPDNRENFIFMVDSMDYLTLESDLEKDFHEARKVAGPQYLTKILWSKLALPFMTGQHIFLAISQQSAAPKIDARAKDPLRQGGSSGGTNIQYQSSLVIDFSLRYEGDYILADETEKYDPEKNDKIGHVVKAVIRKSDVERYDVKFEYSVKYGRTGGNSVWIERDLVNVLKDWHLITGAGSWYTMDADLVKEIRVFSPEFPEKLQGINAWYEVLTNDRKVLEFLINKFKEIYASTK